MKQTIPYLKLPIITVSLFLNALTFAQSNSIKYYQNYNPDTAIYSNNQSIKSSIETVQLEDISTVQNVNLLSTLQGKANGVDIQTGTWGNSASSIIDMRGNLSLLGNTQPLFVVDGMPVIGGFDDPHSTNILSDLNIDEIESVSFYKGPVASILYGAEAANGAVLINLKKSHHQGLHIELNSSVFAKQLADFPEYQNQFGPGIMGEYHDSDNLPGWGPEIEGNPYGWKKQGSLKDEYFKTAVGYSNRLALSAANQNGWILASYSNTSANDVVPESKNVSNTIGLRGQHKLFDRVELKGSVLYNTLNDNLLDASPSEYGAPMPAFIRMPRTLSVDELRNYEESELYTIYYRSFNPWFYNDISRYDLERTNLFLNYGVNISLVKGLKVSYNGSINEVFNRKEQFVNAYLNYDEYSRWDENKHKEIRHKIGLDYIISNNKNYLHGKVGVQIYNAEIYDAYDQYYGSPDISRSWSSLVGEPENTLYYTLLEYNRNKHFSVRLAGSSDELIDGRSFNYSMSGGFDVASIINNPNILSKLYISAGHAKTGVLFTLEPSPLIILAPEPVSPLYAEKKFSIDLSLLKELLNISFTSYNNSSKNEIYIVPVPSQTGYSHAFINTLELENKGVELNFHSEPIHKSNFEWQTCFSLFKNNNKMKNVHDQFNAIPLIVSNYRPYYWIFHNEGQGQTIWGRQAQTHFGLPVYRDGSIQYEDELKNIAEIEPDYRVYFSNKFNIYGFKLSVLLEYQNGGSFVSTPYYFGTVYGTVAHTTEYRNSSPHLIGYNYDYSTDTYIPINSRDMHAQDYYHEISEPTGHNIMDATFLRINELSLSYDFNIRKNARLTLTLFGHNLYNWNKHKSYTQSRLSYMPRTSDNYGNQYNYGFQKGVASQDLPPSRFFGIKVGLKI